MKNEYIEVAKRWLEGEVFSVKALKANADAAWTAYAWVYADAADDDATSYALVYAAAAAAAYDAAYAAYDAAAYDAAADAADADAAHWVRQYEELTK